MDLKLSGHFSYIDKWDKLKFTYLDDKTREKLTRHCLGSAKPFTGGDFTVVIPPTIKSLPEDIAGLIGLDCTIRVVVKPYSFVSKLGMNRGEKVTGSRLVLTSIERI